MKKNITFYGHDADSHNHWKFKTLRRKYGWGGEGKFWALNNIIAESDYCKLDLNDEDKKMAVAIDLDFDVTEFDEYINFLFKNCKLIICEDGVITTARVMESFEMVNSKRERDRDRKVAKNIDTFAGNPNETLGKEQLSTRKTDDSTLENEQTKLKEIKGNINTVESSKKAIGSDLPTPPKKTLEEKQKEMLVRRKVFQDELMAYQDRYPKETINAFYRYWGEASKSKLKMKWELQQTWETERRLATWFRKQDTFQASIPSASTSFRPQPLEQPMKILL